MEVKRPVFSKVADPDEGARINSVICKCYRRKEDEKVPETNGQTNNLPNGARSIRSIALQNLTRLAGSHRSLGRLPEAASAYYKVIVGYEKADGDFAGPIFMATRSLTEVLKAQKEYEEAESVLVCAFGLCLKQDRSSPLLDKVLRSPW